PRPGLAPLAAAWRPAPTWLAAAPALTAAPGRPADPGPAVLAAERLRPVRALLAGGAGPGRRVPPGRAARGGALAPRHGGRGRCLVSRVRRRWPHHARHSRRVLDRRGRGRYDGRRNRRLRRLRLRHRLLRRRQQSLGAGSLATPLALRADLAINLLVLIRH